MAQGRRARHRRRRRGSSPRWPRPPWRRFPHAPACSCCGCPSGGRRSYVLDYPRVPSILSILTIFRKIDDPGHFSPRAEISTLERNYRSTQPILAAANAVINLAKESFTKNLWARGEVKAKMPDPSGRQKGSEARCGGARGRGAERGAGG